MNNANTNDFPVHKDMIFLNDISHNANLYNYNHNNL